jgi:predicted RNA binding protein YcfA (HicA-like mRNA interferase family)
MPKSFYPDLIRLLRQAGFRRIEGGKGSHEKWRSADGRLTATVPHAKSRLTANEVLKQAGLPKAF